MVKNLQVLTPCGIVPGALASRMDHPAGGATG
jgi:hypothetical protein